MSVSLVEARRPRPRPHIAKASRICRGASESLIGSRTSSQTQSCSPDAMSTMITFAANNEFFRKRKRA